MLAEFLFRPDFIESQPALFNSFAGVSKAPRFENLLHLTVFAKGSVQSVEGKINIVRQFKLRVPHIDIDDIRAK